MNLMKRRRDMMHCDIVIMTSTTTPVLCQAFYDLGIAASPNQLTMREAEAVTNFPVLMDKGLKIGAKEDFSAFRFFKNVTTIPNNCFFVNTLLTAITLPESLVSIGHNAFRANVLDELIIPQGVTSIGMLFLYGNKTYEQTKFVNLICKPIVPPTAQSRTFEGIRGLKIYVPDESLDTYKQAPYWSDVAEVIYPISELTGGG